MQIIWSLASRNKLIEIRHYIAEHNPTAAAAIASKILVAGNSLREFPRRGRPANQPNIRELVISGTPYLLIYQVDEGNRISILNIWHGAQDR
ncbi:MAG: type II toxin-antitoxin system RelE/ParE family toxin [Rhodospirillaceae bacterium]